MSDEPDEIAQTGSHSRVGHIRAVTVLVSALAGLLAAGTALYKEMPGLPGPVSIPEPKQSTAEPQQQAPTRSYIQLASFSNKPDAEEAGRAQAKQLLRQVCVYDSRGVFATALGPMLTADAHDLVPLIRQHSTVDRRAVVVLGKSYVSTGKCFAPP
jgi:hypothetical protein